MSRRKTYDTLERYLKRYYRQADIILKEHNKKALAELREVLSNTYEQYGMESEELFTELQKYKRMGKLENEITKTLTGLTTVGIVAVRNTLTDVFKATYQSTFKDIQDLTGKVTKDKYDALPFIQKKMKALDVVDQMNMGTVWNKRLKNYSDKEINSILTDVRQGIYQGKSYQSITKDLKDQLWKSYSNTMRVVRTEGKRVQSECQLDVMDSFSSPSYDIYKIWHNSQDERVRDNHKGDSMEGQRVLQNEYFIFPDGDTAIAPGMAGSAKNSINCRCYMEIDYVLKK